MTELASTPPRRILLATDLSARCDRALDRAALLATTWHAELVVLHVLEESADLHTSRWEHRLPSWRQPLATTTLVEEQIRHDMAPLSVQFSVVVEEGKSTEAILRTAQTHSCDLIVTGLARDEALGRFQVGGTVERLLRRANAPLLVVRGRARSHYERIVVGTDFSACSRHALLTALQFFPEQRLTVFHAYDAPLVAFAGDPTTLQHAYGKLAEQICREFLQTVPIPAERRNTIQQLVEPGSPRRLLYQLAHDRGIELVVLGPHGRNALLDMFVGSTTREILASLPCDALVVRGPTETADEAAGAS